MKKLPSLYERFMESYPGCGAGYQQLAEASRSAAGFPGGHADLLKLALAMGGRLEGAVHSHTRRALEAGATPEEVRGVALLALTTLGFPHAMMGLSWVEDVLRDATKAARKAEKEEKKAHRASEKVRKKTTRR